MTHTTTLRRFASRRIEPDKSIGLNPAHPAAVDGHTIFPKSVIATRDSPRLLISGHNNPKLGKTVRKGPRAGWPIYQLSLEERATCPRSCHAWFSCYGNAMPYTRRHTPDADFLPRLRQEVADLCAKHPDGLLIRLHGLGDFYSVAYVETWAGMLRDHPALHIFGYTARDGDIGLAVYRITQQQWDRFSIRFSRQVPTFQSSMIVDEPSEDWDVIMCPAQTGATEACATCALCWAPAARDKTIGFLRHGMKRRRVA